MLNGWSLVALLPCLFPLSFSVTERFLLVNDYHPNEPDLIENIQFAMLCAARATIETKRFARVLLILERLRVAFKVNRRPFCTLQSHELIKVTHYLVS